MLPLSVVAEGSEIGNFLAVPTNTSFEAFQLVLWNAGIIQWQFEYPGIDYIVVGIKGPLLAQISVCASIKLNHLSSFLIAIVFSTEAELKSFALPSGNIFRSFGYLLIRVLKVSIDNDTGCVPLFVKFYVIDGESITIRYSSYLELQTICARINGNIENLGMEVIVRGSHCENLLSIPEDISLAWVKSNSISTGIFELEFEFSFWGTLVWGKLALLTVLDEVRTCQGDEESEDEQLSHLISNGI